MTKKNQMNVKFTNLIEKKEIPRLLEIEKLCFKECDQNRYLNFYLLITRDTSNLNIVKDGSKIIGYYHIVKYGNVTLKIYKIAIHPDYQNKEIGKNCIERIEKYAKKNKFSTIKLEVRKDNKKAIFFYKKLGYMKIDEVPSFYRDSSSAFIFEKML